MTRDEVLAKWNALTADKRDEWVHEKVFDGCIHRFGDYATYSLTSRCYVCDKCGEPVGEAELGRGIPPYTREISAAWEVAAAMRKKAYRLHYEWRANGHFAYFDPPHGIGERGKGGTAPEAICLAALLVVEGGAS